VAGGTAIHGRILELLTENPEGLSVTEIRRRLQLEGEEHQHLDRRIRELDEEHIIERVRKQGATLYVYKSKRDVPRRRSPIHPKVRAEVLINAHGTCAMCGRTIQKDGITLEVDHIVPVEWGGTSDIWNLQALCSEDNGAKKAYFAGFDPQLMKKVYSFPKVHQRIGQLLIALQPNYVESSLLGAVAGQEDWQKRLRELRTIGWEIAVKKVHHKNGRVTSAYRVEEWTELSDDPAADIRHAEKQRGTKR
jgi:5-methylcytosine-specific restriction endonuclease McrA